MTSTRTRTRTRAKARKAPAKKPTTPRKHARARVQKDRSGDVVFSIVALVVVFGSLLGIVVVQTFIVQNRVQLDAVNAELNIEREKNQQLRLEVIELEAPKRILDTATTRLGMVRPEQRAYLPGIDPNLVTIQQPGVGNPFGPAPLPESLMPTTTTQAPVPVAVEDEVDSEDVGTDDAGTDDAGTEETGDGQ